MVTFYIDEHNIKSKDIITVFTRDSGVIRNSLALKNILDNSSRSWHNI